METGLYRDLELYDGEADQRLGRVRGLRRLARRKCPGSNRAELGTDRRRGRRPATGEVWPGCLQPDVRIAGDHQIRLSATAALSRLRFWFPTQRELYLQQSVGVCKFHRHQRSGRHSPGVDSGLLQEELWPDAD